MKKLLSDVDDFYFDNNKRKMHGIPLLRKKNKKKRICSRRETDETISEFVRAVNGWTFY